jgi:preprotein translocase subunit SecF
MTRFWPLIRLVPRQTHFNFVGLAPYAAALSALALLGAVASFFVQGMNFGVDFVGGTVMEVTTPGSAPLGQIRSVMAWLGAHDAQVQVFGNPRSARVQFRSVEGKDTNTGANFVATQLASRISGLKVSGQSTVGAKVSGELVWSGVFALGTALALMLLYIWFRFQLQFGLGAILALFHDIALTIGLLCVTQVEVSMTSIAALLTVIASTRRRRCAM